MKRIGEDHGFRATIEKVVLDGHGHIDVALERNELSIACEISISTRADHEIQNLTKCLASGFDWAVLICPDARTLAAARGALAGAFDQSALMLPADLGDYLDSLPDERNPKVESPAPPTTLTRVKTLPKGGGVRDMLPALSEPAGKQILIARDAAAYLGLARQTLAKLRWAGTSPPFYKIGRQVMYDRTELDVWLSRHRRRSTTQGWSGDVSLSESD